jgi:ParB family chromosome partitioning protein
MVATNTLSINEIVPNKDQPRKTFDEGTLMELADSIRQHGVLQPLLVRPLPNGGYSARCWRAPLESVQNGRAQRGSGSL